MSEVLSSIVKTHKAAGSIQKATAAQIYQLLEDLSKEMVTSAAELIAANKEDLSKQDPDNPKNDRLMLNEQRITGIAASVVKVAGLPDPTGKVLESRTLPNGLKLQKIAVPLGVVGAIYESRPNVTFDIAALCLRSRNACVLKGSSDAHETNLVAVRIIKKVLKKNNIDEDVVTLLPPAREVVQEMFTATKYIDVIIPRGSDSLIQFVRKNSLVPVIETGAGVCHVYVEENADLGKALNIVVNAKTSRPSVCNAADAILIDRKVAPAFLSMLKPEFEKFGVEMFADDASYKILDGYPHLAKAKPEHYGQEFLSLKLCGKSGERY